MKKKKKEHHEEHMDETWLIPYSDMLVLLLALFIVMFSMSQVDKEKFKKVSEQFNVIFSDSGEGVQEGGSTSISFDNSSTSAVSDTITEQDTINEFKKMLEQEIQSGGYADRVKVELDKEGLQISIQDIILFNSGDAEVLNKVTPLLLQISKMLKGLDNNIRIVGHTDNIPIKNEKFRSNWDLSAARAINVMSFMVDSGGMNPEKLSIQAYGQYMPKYNNSTEEGRSKNRRVEIFIVRKYPLTTEETGKND